MRRPDPIVANWIAEGETTVALFCIAKGCRHHASVDISGLPPETKRSQIIRRAQCAACGSRNEQLMRDIMRITGGSRRAAFSARAIQGSSADDSMAEVRKGCSRRLRRRRSQVCEHEKASQQVPAG